MGESEPSCVLVVRVNFSVTMMLCLCDGAVDHVLSLFPKTELRNVNELLTHIVA